MLSLAERYEHDGIVKGKAKGLALGVDRMLELIESGLSPRDAQRKVKEEKDRLIVC